MTSSFTRFLDHTQRRTTVGRTPLDEWSVRRRDLYLTTHNTHNRQTSMAPGGIRTHSLSRWAAEDQRLRPRGHWDPLSEWSARRRDLYLTTHNTHNRQTSMPPGGIRTHNLSRWAAADLRLRPRGHWDPLGEWSARFRKVTTQNTHKRHVNALGVIRTHNPSKREAADLRLRLRGHWVRLTLFVQHIAALLCHGELIVFR